MSQPKKLTHHKVVGVAGSVEAWRAVDIPERKARIDSIFGRIFILKVSEDGRKEGRQMHSIHSAVVQRIYSE